jgi:hypothetical protein
MKKRLIFSLIVAGSLLFSLTGTDSARAQVPGAIISAGALGGFQSSNVSGVGAGNFYAIRGAFSGFFGEMRHANWGGSDAYINDNGFLGGMDFSLFSLMLSGAVGAGSTTYQAPAVLGVVPAAQTYTSFLYEAQAMYQFNIVSGFITAGIGVDYIGEANSVAPIAGWGGVASINIGL